VLEDNQVIQTMRKCWGTWGDTHSAVANRESSGQKQMDLICSERSTFWKTCVFDSYKSKL